MFFSDDLDVSDLNSEKDYAPTSLYARTKLLNILMTRYENKYKYTDKKEDGKFPPIRWMDQTKCPI